MSDEERFAELMQQVLSGNGEAITCLVREFESELRRAVRNLLRGRPHAVLETNEVVQSVLRRLLERIRKERTYEQWYSRQGLFRFLYCLAREYIIRWYSTRRNNLPLDSRGTDILDELADVEVEPAFITEDLLEKAQSLCDPEDWKLLVDRAGGLTWKELADRSGFDERTLRRRCKLAVTMLRSVFGGEGAA